MKGNELFFPQYEIILPGIDLARSDDYRFALNNVPNAAYSFLLYGTTESATTDRAILREIDSHVWVTLIDARGDVVFDRGGSLIADWSGVDSDAPVLGYGLGFGEIPLSGGPYTFEIKVRAKEKSSEIRVNPEFRGGGMKI